MWQKKASSGSHSHAFSHKDTLFLIGTADNTDFPPCKKKKQQTRLMRPVGIIINRCETLVVQIFEFE